MHAGKWDLTCVRDLFECYDSQDCGQAVCNAPKTEVTCLSTVQGISRMQHAKHLLCGTVSSEPSILLQHKQGMGALQQQERQLP